MGHDQRAKGHIYQATVTIPFHPNQLLQGMEKSWPRKAAAQAK